MRSAGGCTKTACRTENKGDDNMSNDPKKPVISSRLSNTMSVTGCITAIIICAAFFVFLKTSLGGNKYVDMVRGGTPYAYPEATFDQAFSSFFSEPTWKYFRSTDNRDIVEFSGKCLYNGKLATVLLQFDLDLKQNTFSLIAGKINGETQSVLTLNKISTSAFDSYVAATK